LKKFAKVTGPNQFSLAVGHRTTAKVDDWRLVLSLYEIYFTRNVYGNGLKSSFKIFC